MLLLLQHQLRASSRTTRFEVPATAGVKFHDLVTVSLGGTGTIAHVINNTGGAVNSGSTVSKITTGP